MLFPFFFARTSAGKRRSKSGRGKDGSHGFQPRLWQERSRSIACLARINRCPLDDRRRCRTARRSFRWFPPHTCYPVRADCRDCRPLNNRSGTTNRDAIHATNRVNRTVGGGFMAVVSSTPSEVCGQHREPFTRLVIYRFCVSAHKRPGKPRWPFEEGSCALSPTAQSLRSVPSRVPADRESFCPTTSTARICLSSRCSRSTFLYSPVLHGSIAFDCC